jgi:hypothetical protein
LANNSGMLETLRARRQYKDILIFSLLPFAVFG